MKPQGSLAERDFPSLVQNLYEQRWNGVLTLTAAGIGKNVHVQEGRLVFASSSSPDDRLGELLLRKGRLSLHQFVQAGKSVGPGKRLGAVLIEQGFLDPKDLVKSVVEHTQEIIYGAFQLTEGQYRLQPGSPSVESITLKISTPDLILEGIRRIDAWSRINQAVGGLTAVYERDPQYEETIRWMSLTLEKLGILTGLHQPKTVEALCKDSTLSDFEVCRTLWAYRVVGVVRRLDAAPESQRAVTEDEGLGFVLPQE
jgi:uncharacterized protein DUF4388